MNREKIDFRVLVRGSNDVASAVAHRLFGAGYGVVIHDDLKPTTTRRKMAFTDALYDGEAMLEGILAKKIDSLSSLRISLISHEYIPILTNDFYRLLEKLRPQVIVDARMRKHTKPSRQIHLAPLTIGLGPNFSAGVNVRVAIETLRGDDLGKLITQGATSRLTGEPVSIAGHARDRYVYAPSGGKFSTSHTIGDEVVLGQEIANIDSTPLFAPIAGVIRGITRDDIPVVLHTKVIEIDPRGENAQITGIGERPARIAEGVLIALQRWEKDADLITVSKAK